MTYILYNPRDGMARSIQNILKYLEYLGYDLEPTQVNIENIDIDINEDILQHLPMIYTYDNKWYFGEYDCIKFYSDATLILHLKDKADNFNKYELSHPFYPRKLRKIKIE
jgi:hypothetical protein